MSEGENSVVMSSEESSTHPDESDLELGLGLSLGCGDGGKGRTKLEVVTGVGSWDHYARILTAEDFHSVVSTKASPSSSTSSSSFSSVNKVYNNGSCGSKRTAELPSSPPGRRSISQVVGWPPVRTCRMNLVNNAISPVTEDFLSTVDECKSKNVVMNDTNQKGNTNDIVTPGKGPRRTSLFVKVNMDGIPIGRKIDLSSHRSYETLLQALDDMFKLSTAIGTRRPHLEEQTVLSGQRQSLKILDGSSNFVLTYEDKDKDWMLVGDVPWELFVYSVRRLRIMRTTEANGLGSHGRSRKQ